MRDSGEICDDGNTFDYDGCSSTCDIEESFICSGGTATTRDTCVENTFSPVATMTVMSNNDLTLTFNDTMVQQVLSPDDISLRIYGPQTEYSLTWT